MDKQYFTMDDFDFKGKTVLLRADLNSPLAPDGSIEDSERIAAHANVVRELSGKGARTAVLAHQGRVFGKDFLPLKQHAVLLERHSGVRVQYLDALFSDDVTVKLGAMRDGDVLLLENTRFYSEEASEVSDASQYAKALFVRRLSAAADYFVNDAFSVSHRAQASVVGFPQMLPSAAGRNMERELIGLAKALEHAERPNVYVLGGAKPDDVYGLLKFALSYSAVDKILVSGVLGELCLAASGISVGYSKEFYFKQQGFDKIIPELKQFLASAPSGKAVLPSDMAVEEDKARAEYPVSELARHGRLMPYDIGAKTIAEFSATISSAKTVYYKGPQGFYENPLFENGTRTVLKAIESSRAFSLMGGGHSLSALAKFGIDKGKISHISLAGGAVVEYLQGRKLPGIEALKASFRKAGGPT
ncbi:MAG: phosphoglycerate kinase [Candidatus Micrarchaeota archaeon]